MERANEVHVRFWDAVSGFAGASRLSVGRQKAVVEVERIVEQIERAAAKAAVLAAVERVRTWSPWHGSLSELLDAIEKEARDV